MITEQALAYIIWAIRNLEGGVPSHSCSIDLSSTINLLPSICSLSFDSWMHTKEIISLLEDSDVCRR